MKATRKKFVSRLNPPGSGVIFPAYPLFLITAAPIKKIDRVDSIKGAPRIAPTPISSLWLDKLFPEMMARSGTMVSGSAVPTAANSEPVTPCERRSLWPRCSSALVKISAAMRMMTREKNLSNRINHCDITQECKFMLVSIF